MIDSSENKYFRLRVKEVASLKTKKFLMLFIGVLLLNLCNDPLIHAAPKAQFHIVYTNDVMGEVEPCG